MADDDWRVTVTLHDAELAERAVRFVREREVEADVHRRLGHRVAVSADGPSIFLYAGTEDAAREAERVVREVLAERRLDAEFALDRWHPDEEAWEDAGAPVPETAAEREAEHQRLVDEETRESLATGQAGWEVRVEMPSRREAAELAERLRADGRPVIRRWKFVVVGANNEDDAGDLAKVIERAVPAGATVFATVAVPFV